MTDNVDIVNRALQAMGTRTTVTSAELTGETSNEAIQANLVLTQTRDQLLRMAPWDCALHYANLDWITALPGTPENQSAGTTSWERGQPLPPWVYEYQYPVDCLRACFIVPQVSTALVGGVPIYPVPVGPYSSLWQTPPVRFKVATDIFRPVTAAAISAGGTGYAVGDEITLARGETDEAPIGAPAKLLVATLGVGSAIATVTVVNQVLGSSSPQGGSYFDVQTGAQAQDSTDGAGTGATFTLTQGAKASQRVILTNQPSPTLAYCKQVTDPNVMDPLFQEAWISVLGSFLCMALTGDKALANRLLSDCNTKIMEARKADGNEGLTINNVTPDFIRVRGVDYNDWAGSGNPFDWGGLWGAWG